MGAGFPMLAEAAVKKVPQKKPPPQPRSSGIQSGVGAACSVPKVTSSTSKGDPKQAATSLAASASASTAVPVGKPRPSVPLLQPMLKPRPFVTPVKGWVKGPFRPERNPGRLIAIPFTKVAGVFSWTQLAEEDYQKRETRGVVEYPDPDKFGIDRLKRLDFLCRKDGSANPME